jgi:hypothetical protein
MNIEKIVDTFIQKPNYLDMGAGKLSKRWNCTKDDIYKAKEEARAFINSSKLTELQNIISEQEDVIAKYIGSETSDGATLKKFESARPLSPEEIKELAQVDGINTRVARVWDKLLPTGKWIYSIDIRYNIDEFYSRQELEEKLKEIFPSIPSASLPIVKEFSEKALVILISDDHAGAVIQNSMFGNEWNEEIYTERLLKISNEAKKLGTKFEEVHIISLGDQMNGWNSQTTRGGHEVKSLSNREQFDIYTRARVAFYDDILCSGLAKNYIIHDVENSNHAGKDFSYIANRFLDMYLENKYPTVERKSYLLPVDSFDYGIHTIGFTHGKDEKLMTRPMPLKLDPKTDLFLFQYFDKKGISPSERRITLYKGDLHQYALDKGKFGRYVNIPSMMGSTDWTEINFGNTEGGAILEIFDKHSRSVQHVPVWF